MLNKFVPERLRQPDVIHINGLDEQRGNFTRRVTGNTTSDGSYEEGMLGVLLGIADEPFRLLLEDIQTIHRVDGVAVALHSLGLPHDGTELFHSNMRGAATMFSLTIAAKYKDLAGPQELNLAGS